jgi:hypothetical protein
MPLYLLIWLLWSHASVASFTAVVMLLTLFGVFGAFKWSTSMIPTSTRGDHPDLDAEVERRFLADSMYDKHILQCSEEELAEIDAAAAGYPPKQERRCW